MTVNGIVNRNVLDFRNFTGDFDIVALHGNAYIRGYECGFTAAIILGDALQYQAVCPNLPIVPEATVKSTP